MVRFAMGMSVDAPLVSVVLPTYNRARLIARAVRSVLQQSYPFLELIVVDDGSTDGTDAVVRAFRDPRLRFFRLARNRGPAAARNEGIRHARGELLAFQDSDDEWLPQKLARQVPALLAAPPGVAMVYGSVVRVAANGRERCFAAPVFTPEDETTFDRALALGVGGIAMPACLIRREAFLEVGGFDEHLRCLEDTELFIRLARHYRFQYLEPPLVRYYATPDSISLNDAALIAAGHYFLDKFAADLASRPWARAAHHRALMYTYFRQGDVRQARAQFRALQSVVRPAPRDTLRVALSYLGPRLSRALWDVLDPGLSLVGRARRRLRTRLRHGEARSPAAPGVIRGSFTPP